MDDTALMQLAESVEGLVYPDDCLRLYRELKESRVQGDALEVGNFKGRITVCLAEALRERGAGRLYTVDSDLFGAREQLLRNIERNGVKEQVVAVRAYSARFNRGWKGPLAFIWLDTDASYFSLASDFLLWEPFLQVGGVFAFGGAGVEQASRFVREYLEASGRFSPVEQGRWVMYARKRAAGVPLSGWRKAQLRVACAGYYHAKALHHKLLSGRAPGVLAREHALKRFWRSLLHRVLR